MAGNNGVICSQSEIRKAYNNISNYIDFLDRMYTEYTKVISDLVKQGIKSAEISSALADINDEVSSYTGPNEGLCLIMLKNAIEQYFNAISNVDDMVYPSNYMDEVRSLLSMFL